ncbi:hypothetical protein HK097_010169 [Rhizophlyctis rosea]|uniref:Uncharacterized protein n=1 Tax=Rhizophlyctis rosea TaxID=64517 RepID=A0AAD5S800_9FUNG|nr:hypothetical protein HK097_010169 [Rhizophlyctis rosea]
MSFLRDTSDDNVPLSRVPASASGTQSQSTTELVQALQNAALEDRQAGGESPPPSRPPPMPVSGRRKRQYKSTENVAKVLDDHTVGISPSSDAYAPKQSLPQPITESPDHQQQSPEASPDASISPTDSQAPPVPPPRRSRRAPGTSGTSGWDTTPSSPPPKSVTTSQDIGDEPVEIVKKQTSHTVSSSPTRAAKQQQSGSIPDISAMIPDLEDAEQDEMISSIAMPPQVKGERVRTIRELDAEGGWERGAEHSPVPGIDLSLLASIALCPPDMIAEPDVPWDWDVLFTEISSEMQAEMEEAAKLKASLAPVDSVKKGILA